MKNISPFLPPSSQSKRVVATALREGGVYPGLSKYMNFSSMHLNLELVVKIA